MAALALLPGPAVSADGTLKDASQMEWAHSRSPTPIPLSEPACNNAALPTPIPASSGPSLPTAHSSALPQPKGSNKRKQPPTAAIVPNNKKRHDVFWTDKAMILDWMRDNKRSQSDTAKHWQKHGFPNLKQGTISKWVKDEARIRENASDPTQHRFKRERLVENPEMEASLKAWCLDKINRGIKLTGDVIVAKARTFETLHNPDIRDEDRATFANSWLDKFKKRIGLKEWRSHGEAGSVAQTSVEVARKRLRALTDKYNIRDILNFDEAGLNHRMPPDRGLAQEALPGVKGDKSRLTYGHCTSADGLLKLDPLIIGHAKRPRCFQKRNADYYGFSQYYWNKKAWMTGSIFMSWLLWLDKEMKRLDRKVLLLVDNAPSHIYDPSKLFNVTVSFLEPNMTSHIQPLDAGIIRAWKAQYRRLYIRRALERDDAGVENIWKIDQLEAMKIAEEAWSLISVPTIANCWRHAGIISPRGPDGMPLPEQQVAEPASSPTALVDEGLDRAVKGLGKALEELKGQHVAARNLIGKVSKIWLTLDRSGQI